MAHKYLPEVVVIFIFTIHRRQLLQAGAALLFALVLLIPPLTAAQPVFSAASAENVKLPVIMYHSLLTDPNRAGEYVISPAVLEQDLQALRQRGYTCVLMRDVINYVFHGASLPEKPVVITLDDGYLNNLLYLPDILERNDACAVISVVGEYIDIFSRQADPNPTYAHLTWTDIGQLSQNPRIEIANHSYNLHHQEPRKGAQQNPGESDAHYRQLLTEDALALNQALLQHSGVIPLVYTYPYGQITPGADEILRDAGFAATLSCHQRVTTVVQGQPSTLYSIGRFNRPAGISTDAFIQKVTGE